MFNLILLIATALHPSGSPKRRIPQNIVQLLRLDHILPRCRQGIGAHDVRRVFERNGGNDQPEGLAQFYVHDVFHEPEGDAGHVHGKFLKLDAVKLLDGHAGEQVHIQPLEIRVADEFFAHGQQDAQLQLPQFPVGDDKEIAAAAGRVQKGQ